MAICNELFINAAVERVWGLSIDVEDWPRLTPTTMTSLRRLDDGPLRLGSTALVKQPRQREAVWTVTRFEPPSLFEWQTKVATITMKASHRLIPDGDGCRNTLNVEASGLGSRLFEKLVATKIREAITVENQCFKSAAERPDSAVGR